MSLCHYTSPSSQYSEFEPLHVNTGKRNLVFFLILFYLDYDAAIKEFLYLLEGIWFVIKKGRKNIYYSFTL